MNGRLRYKVHTTFIIQNNCTIISVNNTICSKSTPWNPSFKVLLWISVAIVNSCSNFIIFSPVFKIFCWCPLLSTISFHWPLNFWNWNQIFSLWIQSPSNWLIPVKIIPQTKGALWALCFILYQPNVVSRTKSGYFKTRSTKTREWRLKMYFENKKIEREICIRSDHQVVKLQLLGAWPTNGRSCMVGGLRKQDTSLFLKKEKLDDELY